MRKKSEADKNMSPIQGNTRGRTVDAQGWENRNLFSLLLKIGKLGCAGKIDIEKPRRKWY